MNIRPVFPVNSSPDLAGFASVCTQNPTSTLSSLGSSKGCYVTFWGSIRAFFAWLFCCHSKKTKEEPSGVSYHKVYYTGSEIKYRLLDEEGAATSNVIRFSKRTATLEEIDFPDEAKVSERPAMLRHILEEEKIDEVLATTFEDAKLLFELGMHTEANLPVRLHGESPVLFLLQTAMQRRKELRGGDQELLVEIEVLVLDALINEALTRSINPSMYDLGREPDLGTRYYPSGLVAIGAALPHLEVASVIRAGRKRFPLPDLIRQGYTELEALLQPMDGSFVFVEDYRGQQQVEEMELEVDVPLESIFRLIDALEQRIPRGGIRFTSQLPKFTLPRSC